MLAYNDLFEPQIEDALRVTVPAVSISERVHQEHHTLFWQVRGGSHFTIDGEAIRLFAGQALWVPVGTSHEFSVGDKSVLLPLFFEAEDDFLSVVGVNCDPGKSQVTVINAAIYAMAKFHLAADR